MGIIMTAFSAAAALGVPFGLKLAQWWQWETPFLFIAVIAALAWSMLFRVLPPVRGHLEGGRRVSVRDFLDLLRDGNAWRGITLMVATVWGHFTVIPYLSPFLVRNVGMPEKSLFLVYLVGGLASIVTGPKVGKLADRYGRFRIYVILVFGACLVIRTLTSSGPLPVWGVLVIAAAFFIFASGRFIPAQAVISLAVPSKRRGAYMSLIGCSRDLAMGVTTVIAGHIITTGPRGQLQHFDLLGLLAIGVSIASLWLFLRVKQAE
jgi:predicted MFS family arabinose efflux permease